MQSPEAASDPRPRSGAWKLEELPGGATCSSGSSAGNTDGGGGAGGGHSGGGGMGDRDTMPRLAIFWVRLPPGRVTSIETVSGPRSWEDKEPPPLPSPLASPAPPQPPQRDHHHTNPRAQPWRASKRPSSPIRSSRAVGRGSLREKRKSRKWGKNNASQRKTTLLSFYVVFMSMVYCRPSISPQTPRPGRKQSYWGSPFPFSPGPSKRMETKEKAKGRHGRQRDDRGKCISGLAFPLLPRPVEENGDEGKDKGRQGRQRDDRGKCIPGFDWNPKVAAFRSLAPKASRQHRCTSCTLPCPGPGSAPPPLEAELRQTELASWRTGELVS